MNSKHRNALRKRSEISLVNVMLLLEVEIPRPTSPWGRVGIRGSRGREGKWRLWVGGGEFCGFRREAIAAAELNMTRDGEAGDEL